MKIWARLVAWLRNRKQQPDDAIYWHDGERLDPADPPMCSFKKADW